MSEERIRSAFDAVHAEDVLKERTLEAVRAQAAGEKSSEKGGEKAGEKSGEKYGEKRGLLAARSSGRGARRQAQIVALRRRLAVAACLVVALVAAGGWAWLTPTATISVDVNPSVELGINRFDRVVSARGVNDDGRALLSEVDVWGATYDEAVDRLLASSNVSTLLAEGGQAEVTVVDQGDSDQCARLLAGVEACASGHENTHCHGADEDDVSAAREVGLSYGKYRLLLEIQGLDPSVTADDVRDLSMREMLDLLESLGGSDTAGDEVDVGAESNDHDEAGVGAGGVESGTGAEDDDTSGHEGHHGGHW